MTAPRLAATLLALLFACIGPAHAQPIPGADDPRLIAAAEDWLMADDPLPPLWQIGELAAAGNVAARQMANGISRFEIAVIHPHLSQEARFALVPPDRHPGGPSPFSPYRVETPERPGVALGRLAEAETFEALRAEAEGLIAAGFRGAVAERLGGVTIGQPPDFEREIFDYAEEVLGPEDRDMSGVWSWLYVQSVLEAQGFRDAPDDGERPLWIASRNEAVHAALKDGYWTAIRAAGLMAEFDPAILQGLAAEDADLVRIGRLLVPSDRDTEAAAALTAADRERIGAVLLRDAERSLYLRPMRTLCRQACPGEEATCMGYGVAADIPVGAGHPLSRPGAETGGRRRTG